MVDGIELILIADSSRNGFYYFQKTGDGLLDIFPFTYVIVQADILPVSTKQFDIS